MPNRKCIGCLSIKDRENMIKITKTKEGKIILNPTSKEVGKSVYICKNLNCVKCAIKKKKIYKELKSNNFECIENIEKELINFF